MKSKEKLEDFVQDLNLIMQDDKLFSVIREGRFVLVTKEENDSVYINLSFKDSDLIHPIYVKKETGVADEIYTQAYMVIFKTAFLTMDYVGMAKDKDDKVINFLSFKTILTKGLDKLKK